MSPESFVPVTNAESQAADQAKQLMGQLLAFGKDRRVPARRVDLNVLVERNLELVRGAVPRNVEVSTELSDCSAGACPVTD